MNLTFEPDLDSIHVNQHVKYLGQRSLRWKANTVQTQIHGSDCSTRTTN